MNRISANLFLVVALSTAALAANNPAAELSDPVEILKKVDAACKVVKSVKYRATCVGTGAADGHMATVEGTVIMSGWSGHAPRKFRIDATLKQPGSSEAAKVTVGSDGEDYCLIDHENRRAYKGTDLAAIGGTGRLLLQTLVTPEFLHPTPFNDEINGDKQELKGGKNIGGEECYEVHVVYAGGIAEAVWHFSKRDFLPRARLDLFTTPAGERGGRQRILSDLVADPKLGDNTFRCTLPQGYTMMDGFAP